ncbi:hypothetical protein LINGRAHAP2_LOCUS14268 [Linum grandiflorum]
MNVADVHIVKLKLLASKSGDGREYDLPTVDEVAALIVDETGGASYQLDVVVEHQSSELQRIIYKHPSIMALQYPLLFPYGEDGWHPNIPLQQPTDMFKTVSQYAHINIQFCNKSRAIKYLFKYINKPLDRAKATIIGNNPGTSTNSTRSISETTGNVDEIKAFMDCRYITPGEACWRIFKFELYSNSPAVLRMSCHLPGEQTVISNTNSRMEQLVQGQSAQQTMLLEWMRINRESAHARQFTFIEFPQHYVWKKRTRTWSLRQRQFQIGRLYYCPPAAEERFYLRMLLHVVKGCGSFEDINTVNGFVHESFKNA